MNDQFIFISIPKTATNSVFGAMKSDVYNHAPAKFMKRKLGNDVYNSKTSFCFIRNPIDLLVSWYNCHKHSSEPKHIKNFYPSTINEWILKENCRTHWELSYHKPQLPYWDSSNPLYQDNWIKDEVGNIIVNELLLFDNLNEDIVTMFNCAPIPCNQSSKKNEINEEAMCKVNELFAKDIEFYNNLKLQNHKYMSINTMILTKPELIIISNTCVGAEIYSNLNQEYLSPFIGTLIPNDLEYLKLCRNILYYINVEPVFNMEPKSGTIFEQQNDGKFYKHKSIRTPYPIVHLEDIEIHYIHDTFANAKDKWLRRIERLKRIINSNNYKIYNCWTMTEFLNNHDDISLIIEQFMEPNENTCIESIFVGPEQYKMGVNYIVDKKYNVDLFNRDQSHVNTKNDQTYSAKVLADFIKHKTP